MTKLTKKILLVLLSTFMLFGLTMGIGCDCNNTEGSGEGGGLPSTPMTAEVKLSANTAKMIVGDYLTITAYTNKVPGLELEFSSENENIATIDEFGLIEAVNKGTTNIVAKYGDVTAKCALTVDFDDSVPEIIDLSALNSNYVVYKGESFSFHPAIMYRGRVYTDGEFTFTSTNSDIVAFDGYTLIAKNQVSVANCYVEGSWRGFDVSTAQTLRKDFEVKVMTEAYISLKGTSEDFIELYTLSEFDGNEYKNTNEFIPEFYAEGEKITDVEFDYELTNGSIFDFNNNLVTAKTYGEAQVDIICEYEGVEYIKTININILRPVADYEMELDNFSLGLGTFKDANDNYVDKTVANKIYGTDDVNVIEAFQDGKTLSVVDNKIFGVSGASNASSHTVITIGTPTEIYNVPLNVYGLYIKTAEDLGYFSTQAEYPDYYYLANDIDAYDYEMPKYGESYNGAERIGLLGIFEGNGHVIKGLTVNTRGIFGGINGGTIQNVAFYDTVLSGYYPCLIAHWENGATTLKNMYVHYKNINVKGGGFYQQRFSLSAIHENIVVEYGISKEALYDRVTGYDDNSANISTFAPQRAQVWNNTMFKNCFSISYAPIGLSSPRSTDYSWASYVVAENQVTQTENAETGRVDLTFKDSWYQETFLPVTGFAPIKKVTALENAIDVAQGIKAYNTVADMEADKDANAEILSKFSSDYWIIDNGVPYWKPIYETMVKLTVKNKAGNVVEDLFLSDVNEYLEFDLKVGTTPLEADITVSAGLKVEGNKVSLENAIIEPVVMEVTLSTTVVGKPYTTTVQILATPEQIVSEEAIVYEFNTKSLDFDAVNNAFDLDGENAISQDNLDGFFVGNSTEKTTGDIVIPVVIKDTRNDVASSTLKLLANGKMYVLTNVKAYTQIFDEASDFDALTLTAEVSAEGHDSYYLVTEDIDASNWEFKTHTFAAGGVTYPSSSDVGFTGIFEGNGHTIDGLKVGNNGLFGFMSGASVRNVAFTNVELSGYYGSLFSHSANRLWGKEEGRHIREPEFTNLFISIKSVVLGASKRVGVLANNGFAMTGEVTNVVIDYTNFSDEDTAPIMSSILNGNAFGTIGGGQADLSKAHVFESVYSISKAPVYLRDTKPYFGENQIAHTLEGEAGKETVTAVGEVLDPRVTKYLGVKGLTPNVGMIAMGVRVYDDFTAMANDKEANAESLATFDTNYWVVVNGVPYWKSAYGDIVDIVVTDSEGNPVTEDILLRDTDTTYTVSLKDNTQSITNVTITAPAGVKVEGNVISLASKPTSIGSYEIKVTATVNGFVVEKVLTISYSNAYDVAGRVLYSKDDKALDLESLNKAIVASGKEPITANDITGYIVNGENVSELDLEVIISNNTRVNQGRNRAVDTAQTVGVAVGDDAYLLSEVYAYTKLIDEAEDLNYFILKGANETNLYNEVDGYFLVTKNIDASELDIDAHVFDSGSSYPGNGYIVDVGFRGVFDGQGYTIDGLTTKSCGLFAAMNAPIVKNVAFTNANITGYYKTLFAKKYNRGKDYANAFNGYEGVFSNVYISINSINNTSGDGNVGILVQETFPATVLNENVIVEYTNVTEDVQAKINAGKNFYMFGASGLGMENATVTYKDCFAITTAPVLLKTSMPGFAENQVEYTINTDDKGKVTIASVGAVLDEQVNTILTICGKELSISHVMYGVRVYDNYQAMAQDTANDYTSFGTQYWSIVNGVPSWNTAYAE